MENLDDAVAGLSPVSVRLARQAAAVLVLGRTDVLPSLSQVPVIPLSTQTRGLPWEVPLGPEDGLPSPCVLKPEWIRIVERSHLGPLIAQLSEERLPSIGEALINVLGLG